MMNSNVTKQTEITIHRDYSIDVFRGMCMILVVLGHSIGTLEDPINRYILSFHMPIFFFISGLCVMMTKKKRNILDSLSHKLSTIGYQYFIFSILGLLLYWTILYRTDKNQGVSFFCSIIDCFVLGKSVVPGFWFVHVLLLISVIYIFFQLFEKYRPVVFVSLSLFVFFLCDDSVFQFHGQALVQRLAGGIFYGLGDFLGLYLIKLYHRVEKQWFLYVLILMLLVLIGLIAWVNSPVVMSVSEYGNPYLFISGSFIACVTFFLISKTIRSQLLKYIGVNSILFLFFHFYALYVSHILYNILIGSGNNNTFPYYFLHLIVAILLCYGASFLVNKYAPYLKDSKFLKR